MTKMIDEHRNAFAFGGTNRDSRFFAGFNLFLMACK
jgi:hypothetical protein